MVDVELFLLFKKPREQGHCLRPKTKVVYLPLIDHPPDPATIMSALLKAKELSANVGQEYVIFTADQQLNRVALNIIWDNTVLFSNVHLSLGGMHLLMSYCGCI